MASPPTPTHAHDHAHDHALAHGQGHEHGHHHGIGHSHASHVGSGPDAARRLTWALIITLLFLVAEVVGGILSNSLALLADAGHMFTDAGALALSLFVAWYAKQPSNSRKTYGYIRLEILAAFVNGATLLAISAWITFEAVLRLRTPEPTQGGMMLAVAVAGLGANLVAGWMLRPRDGDSLNMRGAYLHILGDLLGSLGTVAAALIIRQTGWTKADPIVSILTTLLIVRSSWALVRESVDILMEGAPSHISCDQVRTALADIPGVEEVHDLHVWTLTSGVVAMSAHAVVPDADRHQSVLVAAHDTVARFGIHHVTVQLERDPLRDRELHLHA